LPWLLGQYNSKKCSEQGAEGSTNTIAVTGVFYVDTAISVQQILQKSGKVHFWQNIDKGIIKQLSVGIKFKAKMNLKLHFHCQSVFSKVS
jgi:hypothetical protein